MIFRVAPLNHVNMVNEHDEGDVLQVSFHANIQHSEMFYFPKSNHDNITMNIKCALLLVKHSDNILLLMTGDVPVPYRVPPGGYGQ